MIDEHEPGNGIYTYGAIRDTLDAVGVPASGTISERILWLHRKAEAEAKEAAENLAKCERERDGFSTAWQDAKERLDRARVERDAALDELNAAEQALTDAAVTEGDTLHDRIRELATRAAKYHGALAGAKGERDEAFRHLRETCAVLHREREERAAEKATLGAALHTLRAETESLGESVDRLHEENERLAAQFEFAERVLIAGIRRVIP